MAVFDDNIFNAINNREKLFSVEAKMTILDGRVVFQR